MNNEKVRLSDLLHFSPKQKEAFSAVKTYLYTLYGGAMAGGKSYFLRWMLIALLVGWAARGFRNVEVGLFCEDYGSKEYKRFQAGTVTKSDQQNINAINEVLADLMTGTFEDNIEGRTFYTHGAGGSITATRDYPYAK